MKSIQPQACFPLLAFTSFTSYPSIYSSHPRFKRNRNFIQSHLKSKFSIDLELITRNLKFLGFMMKCSFDGTSADETDKIILWQKTLPCGERSRACTSYLQPNISLQSHLFAETFAYDFVHIVWLTFTWSPLTSRDRERERGWYLLFRMTFQWWARRVGESCCRERTRKRR